MTRTQAIFYSALGALSAAGSVLAQSLGGWDTMLQVLVTRSIMRSAWCSPLCGSDRTRRPTAALKAVRA
ncbi:MAG: hypothetical protein U0N62_03815 [Hydrogeniiclostridium sp.]